MTPVGWLIGIATLIAGVVLLVSAKVVTPETPPRTARVWLVVRVLCFIPIAAFVVNLLT
jgi:hypothetical protein